MYSGSNEVPGLFTVDERSWAIFLAYTKANQTLDEVGRSFGLPAYRVRRIVRQVEAEIGQAATGGNGALDLESAIEDLGLPVRTRNALRSIGCKSIGDVLRLNLSAPVRGLGAKSKETLLERLRSEGFCHPVSNEQPVSEIRLLERSLERIQRRVDWALGSVAKEISVLKQRLRKKVARNNST
jgi:hypothetical protein